MQPLANLPSSTVALSKVEGTTVYAPNGDKLGSIRDLVIDKASGQVRYAALEFGGFLGMGTYLYPLPWAALTFDTEMDGYIANVSKKQLRQAPRHASHQPPTYTADYGRSVDEHYARVP